MKKNLFRTDVIRAGDLRIDREAGIIRGFAVVTKGVTKDARGEFDDASLDSIVSMGNASNMGIKSRFGHPNMSSTALGTFLGRVKNFRRDGAIVRADLHIDSTAYETPDGDLGGYVRNLVESDPEMLGASMVIHWDEEKRDELDEAGNELPPFIRVKKLLSVDVVDDPAANEGFFGMPFFSDSVKPSAEMSAFLDKFLVDSEAVSRMMSFLQRYKTNTNHKGKGDESMLKELTEERLATERPDLFEAVHRLGFEEASGKERERVVSILKKASVFQDMNELALDAVENGLSLDQAVISFQEQQLENLKKQSNSSVGPDGEEEPTRKISHLERAEKYKNEQNCSITEALKATADKRK